MKRITAIVLSVLFIACVAGCREEKHDILGEGDLFEISGTVEFCDEPSDIGTEFCLIQGNTEIEYCYKDIYGEESLWKSDTFYTRKKEDTEYLRKFTGKKVTVSGTFKSEVHGVPYITDISIKE